MGGNDLWGEGEEEGSRHILLYVPFSPSPFTEPACTNERVKWKIKNQMEKSSVWVLPNISGELWVQAPAGSFPLLPSAFRALTSLLCDLLRAPALQEA